MKYIKRWHSFGQSSIRQSPFIHVWGMKAIVKSQRRLTKIFLIAALCRWNWWSTCSTTVPSLDTGGYTLQPLFDNSLPEKKNWLAKVLFYVIVSFVNLWAKHLIVQSHVDQLDQVLNTSEIGFCMCVKMALFCVQKSHDLY